MKNKFSKNSDLIIDDREITEKKPTNAKKSAFETLKFKRNQENRFGKMKHKLTFQSIFTSFFSASSFEAFKLTVGLCGELFS